ncbi:MULTISPECIES: YcnI family copper-binding membrane protein [unclassified Microbacterium]|uniref:YcnI family copper-binding membrane protein n=1 Tax=unclassified Microbacterium TaxID=2609290 RepID=UPI00109C2D2B|nr:MULTISPECIES: YcnI family protein [unclassified Microbacterium]
MSRTTRTRTRRPALATAGVLGGVILALAVPTMAGAHVGVSPDELAAGDHGVLTFSFSHGCENSPTTALRITMPEGLASVAPTMDGDWSIAVERGDDGLVSAVTYTALTPVPNDLRGAVSMSVGLDESTPETLAFPVVQECVDGKTEWTQLAENGEDPHSLDAPAPVVSVAAAAAEGHGDHDAADSSEESAAAPASADPLGIALGAGGLVAGIAALIVAVLAYRRRA